MTERANLLSHSKLTKVAIAFLMVLAAVSSSGSAHAQSPSAHARVLFKEARGLMDKGRFDEACPKLEESLRLDHGMGTQFNLAHCFEKIGRTASAWGLFLDVASAANAAGQSKREKAARQRANALEPTLTRLQIDVAHPVPGLKVTRAEEILGSASWGTPMPVDPGSQQIEASAPGKLTWTQEVRVEVPGETVTVAVPELEDERAPEPPEPEVTLRTAPERDGVDAANDAGMGTGRIVTSTLLAAVGVGGVVTGTVFGLKANSETEAALELCTGGGGSVCNRGEGSADFDGGESERSERARHVKNSDRAALIAYVGFGVGAASLVTSVIVLLTAPSEPDSSDAAALQLQPVFAPGMLGTSLSGRF